MVRSHPKAFLIIAFDVVGELAFGRKFGFLEEGRDIGWMRLLERITLNNTWTGEVPYMLSVIRHPIVQKFVPRFRDQAAELRKLGLFARSCVSARKDRGSDRKDMLTFTFAAHRKNPESYSEMDIISDAHTIVFAGSDTTAIVFPPFISQTNVRPSVQSFTTC
jgi:Cytochrome P450